MITSFGEFVCKKRLEQGMSLRMLSKLINISPEYLSKIENNLRVAPKDFVLKKIANTLVLNEKEREFFFELAAESKTYLSLAFDLVEYVNENEMAHKTLRLAKRSKLNNDDWEEIFKYISDSMINTVEDPSC